MPPDIYSQNPIASRAVGVILDVLKILSIEDRMETILQLQARLSSMYEQAKAEATSTQTG
jgi:hypothetical protein